MRAVAGLQNERRRAIDGLAAGWRDGDRSRSGVLEVGVPHLVQLPAERPGGSEIHGNRRGIAEADELTAVARYCGVRRSGLRVDLGYDAVERALVRRQYGLLEAVR